MAAAGLRVCMGGTEILKGVDLSVQVGDLYGLLGRNGAGKTTTMRCMMGFLPFHGGSCEVFGVPVQRIATVAQPIGVALDPPGMDDSLTVRQNLELARIRGGLRGGRGVDDVLELVGLTHRQNNRGDRLSHGQGRRAAVARALLGDPRLLVLDEPLSGLDPEGVETMLELFQHLSRDQGVTVVLSSHHLREVQEICSRVGLVEDGRVILEGATAALLARAGDGLRLRCADVARARQILAASPLCSEIEDRGAGELAARVPPGSDLVALLAGLAAAGIGLEEFSRDRASLVEVFRRAVA